MGDTQVVSRCVISLDMGTGSVRACTSKALVVAFNPLVTDDDRPAWEDFSVQNQDWLLDSLGASSDPAPIKDHIWGYEDKKRRQLAETCSAHRRRLSKEEKVEIVEPEDSGPYVPVWQLSPAPPANDTGIINYNMFDKKVMKKAAELIYITRKPVLLDVCTQTLWFGDTMPHKDGELQTVAVAPVFLDFSPNAPIVGYFIAVFLWKDFFERILHPEASPVTVVLSNTCDEVFTHTVQGFNVELVGEIDAHDTAFDGMKKNATFADFSNSKKMLEEGLGEHCVYTIDVYPTSDMENHYVTSRPIWYTFGVIMAFVCTSCAFLLYDYLVRRREEYVTQSAEKHERLVSSLFPKNVRSQVLYLAAQDEQTNNSINRVMKRSKATAVVLDSTKRSSIINVFGSEPIAELYPEATVLFADIAGFTAWSSLRDPTEVFTLLESVYHSFDTLAQNHNIFKVETIGDCYVAVSGVPEPDEKHALSMSLFATECLKRFDEVVSVFCEVLGNDTGKHCSSSIRTHWRQP